MKDCAILQERLGAVVCSSIAQIPRRIFVFVVIFISYYSFHCWPILFFELTEIESHSNKVYCFAV